MDSDIIEHNPSLKRPLLAVLSLCAEQEISDRGELEERAEEVWSETYRQSPSTSIDILIRNGALEEDLLVDGKPYDGTLEDLQLDENVADDASVDDSVRITEGGSYLLSRYEPETAIHELFEERPHYADVYRAGMEACDTPDGLNLPKLEEVLEAFPQLQPDPETHQTKVYAQYFIDALESAGAIEWTDAWRTTDAGRAVLAED
ncbi:MAG: hypothetical protein LUD25_05195 [Coriobacteriaceae bacterium]|nr:hypothetical protein [Coriobacteriaceae bacterium]